jgi:hypothetical protein
MIYEDFLVKTFNRSTAIRVTHKESGIKRDSDDVTKACVVKLIQEIRDEVEALYKPCSFALALEAVITNGKGMKIAGDDAVVRAQFPDEYSISDLPYLYITCKYGRVPWAVDSFSPFATWVVVD